MKLKYIVTIVLVVAVILGSAVAFGQIGNNDGNNNAKKDSHLGDHQNKKSISSEMMSITPPKKPEPPQMSPALQDEIRNMAIPKSTQVSP